MGIQGLIPFLKKASSPANIRTFSGCTAAVDAYCWLHKGAFSCADKLAKGEPTDGYIHYCIKMVNILLNAGIQPVMVFDGQRLPSKALTERKRHENRQKYKTKAKECLIKGDIRGARECFQRCTEVTSQMALEVIQACRKLGVDCIVAPYEADAQLAYLCQIGISQVVITEDSDLVLFGCERIIFKMDVVGNGMLVERSKLHLCLGLKAENFTFDKFRYMCIMSGCDYLPSLHGIGLGKALKFFSKTTNPNLEQVLGKIPVYLNMSNVEVTKEYIINFLRANQTFLYQLVYDPMKRKLVPLNPYPPDLNSDDLDYAGPRIADQLAYQIALGNVSVDSLKKVDNFNPDNGSTILKARKRKSIWDPTYSLQIQQKNKDFCRINDSTSSVSTKKLPSVTLSTPERFSSKNLTLKRTLTDEDILTDESLLGLYGNEPAEVAKRCKLEPAVEQKAVENKSPVILPLPKIVQSRYFASPSGETKTTEKVAEAIYHNLTQTTDFRKSLTISPASANSEKCGSQSASASEKSAESTSLELNRLNRFQNTQEISIRDGMSARQRGGSLFFDTAVASKNPSYAARTSQGNPSPSANSRGCGNFGKGSSLHKYFSYSALDSISKSPKNHTEFKQVIRQSKTGDSQHKDDDSCQHVTECHVKLSQNSQTSTSSSSSQISLATSLGTQPSDINSPTSEPAFELKDMLDEDSEENFLKENMEAANILTQGVTTSPKKSGVSALTTVADTNSVNGLSRFNNCQPKKLGQLSARKHFGAKKKTSPVGSQNDLAKQNSIKNMFSKFNYVRSK